MLTYLIFITGESVPPPAAGYPVHPLVSGLSPFYEGGLVEKLPLYVLPGVRVSPANHHLPVPLNSLGAWSHILKHLIFCLIQVAQ